MIAQLRYINKEESINHLIKLGLINEDLTYTAITEAIVWIDKVVDQQGTYDENGEELTPTTFYNGYHIDIMTNKIINFDDKLVKPTNPKHKFAK